MTRMHSMMLFYDHFSDLVKDQSEWSQATFGTDQERGPIGSLKHLEKEAKEAYQATTPEELKKELADCFLLILDASRRAGVKPFELVLLAQDKMKVNRSRTWAKPVADEPVEHIKPVEESSSG